MDTQKLSIAIQAFIKKQSTNAAYYEENWNERKERKAYYQSFTKDKLLAMTEEDFLEYISKLWAVLMWGNKKYVVDKLIEDNGFSTLKKQLADLLYKPFIESFSEIVVLDNREDVRNDCLNLFIGKRPSVDFLNGRLETVYCDPRFGMEVDILQGLVIIAKAKELNGCRYFNSGIFVKLSHSFHSFPSLCFESKLFPSWNNLCLKS